ncbi:MAG: hypothetical protein LUC19_07835, partial [Oscillospiraceae bacterium]|nr:hypothetical protein [Oscillospiraceae bacterium]
MNQIRRITRCGLVALVTLAMLFSVSVTAMAADAASLNFDTTGSLTLTLADSDGKTVSGGKMTIYKVATISLDDGNMVYTLTDEFKDFTSELDITDTTLPTALRKYVQSNNISGTTASVGSDGTVTFDDLELGLYLIVQTTGSGRYKTISPFVVTVPIDNEGVWDYTVDARPKVTVTVDDDDDG